MDDPQESHDSQQTGLGLDPTLAATLAYALGFVSGILMLVLERRDRYVRFHAMQSTITFLAILVGQVVLGFIPLLGPPLSGLLGLLGVVLWVLLMVKAFQGERFKLPMIGDMAEERA